MDFISHLSVAEMSTLGMAHFTRKLCHIENREAPSEIIALSFPIARAAIDAEIGISLGWTLRDEDYLALKLDRSQLPHDILPFAPHDAPVFKSSDFFNSPFELVDADGLKRKGMQSLDKFRRFATAVLNEELVESVEFRILPWGEYDEDMLRIECNPDSFMAATEKILEDVTNIPSTQIIVRR